MELVGHRPETISVIKNILAENGISDRAYAQIFQLMFYDYADGQENEVSYCKSTKEWRIGKKPLSDLRLFCLLSKVHEIVRTFVLSSWDDCIFSSWVGELPALEKARSDMMIMENLTHLRGILKAAVDNMEYKADGRVDWDSETDVEDTADHDNL